MVTLETPNPPQNPENLCFCLSGYICTVAGKKKYISAGFFYGGEGRLEMGRWTAMRDYEEM